MRQQGAGTQSSLSAWPRALTILGLLLLALSDTPPTSADVRSRPLAPRQEDVTSGLRVETRTTYTVDMSAAVVRVHVEASLTNQTPDRVAGSSVEQFYFHGFSVPVLSEAINLGATRGDGRPLSVVRSDTETGVIAFADVDLSPDIYHGDSQTVRVTYDLPSRVPRSDGLIHINRAFATFPVLVFGDPGLTSVEVLTPAGLDIDVVGAEMSTSERDGQNLLQAEAIADPLDWYATILVRDDAGLAEHVVMFGEHEIRLQGWPDDPEWLEVTGRLVEDGLPALEEVVGFGWDEPRQIDIVESVTPYVYGYAGSYEHRDGRVAVIEVGDDLDHFVTLHELAHAWFHVDLFTERWITEAFADEFAALAMEDLGEERPTPEPVTPDDPAAIPLNEWVLPDLLEPDIGEQEAYGYNTSWWIAHQLGEEIGTEQLSAVVRAVDDDRSPYPGPTALSRLGGTADWRTLLDHLEGVGASDEAEQLFRDLVVRPDEVALLDERAAARANYDELLEIGEGWLPPDALRREMEAWDFDAAAALIPEVDTLFGRRDAIAADLDAIDVAVPVILQEEFEASHDLDELSELVRDAEDAADALRRADEARRSVSPLARIGLIFGDVDDGLDAAHGALQGGHYEQAESLAQGVRTRTDDATRDGILLLVGIPVLLGLVGLGIVLRRRGRAHRAPVAF